MPDHEPSPRERALSFCLHAGPLPEDFSGVGSFHAWGRADPAQALDFAARASLLMGPTEAESCAIALAHLGAIRALKQPLPYRLSVSQQYEYDDEGGREPIASPCTDFHFSEEALLAEIPGFGPMPPSFAAASEHFYAMINDYWIDFDLEELDEGDREDGELLLDVLADDMAILHRHFDLTTPEGGFPRLAIAIDESALADELRASLPDAPASPRGSSI